MKKEKILVASSLLLILGLFFCYAIFPKIVNFILKRKVWLKKGSYMRKIYDKMPFPLNYNIYLFNITNPEEVMKGEIPHLQEVGPYCFKEWKERVDQEEDDSADTLTYTLLDRFHFDAEKSAPLTGNEPITSLNMILMGSLLLVKRDRAPMLDFVSKGLTTLYGGDSIFTKATAMQILFDGVDLNCKQTDFDAKAICSALEAEAKSIEILDDQIFRLSLFGMINKTDSGRYTVRRGMKNLNQLGEIVSYNGETEIDTWDGDDCNRIRGTDATIFSPHIKKTDKLWAFTPAICRSMGPGFIKKTKNLGVPTGKFNLYVGIDPNDTSTNCFCEDPPDECPLPGSMDLSACLNIPIVATKPHFYEADKSFLETVHGLEPSEDKHDMMIHIDMFSGIPIKAAKRLMFSLAVEPIEEFAPAANIIETFMPMFWVEEGVTIGKPYINLLKYQLYLALKFNKFLKIMIVLGGLSGYAYFSFMKMKEMKDSKEAAQAIQKLKIKTIQNTDG